MQRFTIVLAGPTAVGKTAIFNQLVHRKFCSTHQATTRVVKESKTLAIGKEHFEIQLSDIGGHRTLFDWPQHYCRRADIILYVTDFTRGSHQQRLSSDLDFLSHTYPHSKLQVVVNKVDILQGPALNRELKKHREWNFDFFICANNPTSVGVLFEELIRNMMNKSKLQEQ